MQRRIVGFHRDPESHQVADLDCGHARHVRHDPPLVSRPWVLEETSRAERVGTLLDCVRCDALEWPAGLEPYRRTPVFETGSIPAPLGRDHATKPGVWGRIHVLRGRLRYCVHGPTTPHEQDLSPGHDGIIPPEVRHHVEAEGDVAFFIEFHRLAAREP